MKKIILFVIVLLLISSVSGVVSATAGFEITEDFNSYAIGTVDSDNFRGCAVCDFPSINNKSVSLLSNTYYTFDEVDSGGLIISYDFYITSKNNQKRLMQIFDSTKNGDKRPVVIYAEPNGAIKANGSFANCYYPLNKWFNITLVMDIDNRKFDLYMDRMLCLEDASFWKEDAKEVAVIETVANSELTYIDNVLIKSGYADKAAATADVTDMINSIVYRENNFDVYPVNIKAKEISGFGTVGTDSSIIVSASPKGDGNALKFVGGNGYSQLWNTLNTSVDSGAMIISYDFYLTSIEVETRLLEVYGTYNDGSTRSIQVGTYGGVFTINNNKRNDFPYEANKWYNISLLCDIEQCKTYVYIDGECVDKNGFGLFNDADGIAVISFIKTLYNTVSEAGKEFYADNIYAESFANLDSAKAVLDVRLNSLNLSGVQEYDDIYDNNIAGYLGEYRALAATAEGRNIAVSNVLRENSNLLSVCNLLWSENYESYSTEHEITASDGYMSTTTYINPKVKEISGNKVVKLESEGKRARFLKYYDSAPDSFMVSFDFMQEVVSDIYCLARTSNSHGNNVPFEIYTSNGSIGIRTKDGNITILPKYEAGKWYTIKYYVDLPSETFFVEIENETNCNSNYGFYSHFENANSIDLNRLFDTWTDVTGVYYLDNILVYEDKLFETIFPVELDNIIIVDTDLPIPQSNFAEYEWYSKTEVLIDNGKLIRPETTVKASIMLKASVNSYSAVKEFNVTFLSDSDMSAQIANAKNSLYIPNEIFSPIIALPQSKNTNIMVVWSSSDDEIIDTSGNVTFPADTDADIVLTAKLTYIGADEEKVPAQTVDIPVTVKNVPAYVISDTIYLDAEGSATRNISDGGMLKKIYVKKSGSDEAQLISAAYSNDSLLGVNCISVKDGWNVLDWSLPSGTDNIKSFVLKDLTSLTPVSDVSQLKNEDTTLWMLGDSMMATYDASATARVGWGSILDSYFNSEKVTVRNENAKPGYALKSAISSWYLNNVLAGIKQNDYVIISYGHNDSHENDSAVYLDPATGGDYQEYLTKYVDAVRSRGGQPVLITSIERCQYTNGVSDNTLKKYADSMKEVADNLCVPVIDVNTMTNNYLNEAGYDEAKKYYMVEAEGDRTHINGMGAVWVCDYIVEQLRAMGLPVSDYVL